MLALTISLSGASYAAVVIGTADLENNAVTSKKIKNSTITAKDLAPATVTALKGQGPTGATGATGASGPAGARGADGADGAVGPAGSARAYGVFSADSSGDARGLDPKRSKGIAAVTSPEFGVYCITLSDDTIDPTTIAPVVGVEWDTSATHSLSAFTSIDAVGCSASADFGVRTFTWTSTSESARSNSVGFTVLVP